VYETPDALNQMSEEVLELHVAEALSAPGLERSRDMPLLSFITKSLVRRIYKVLGDLDAEQRGGRTMHVALARTVNDMLHGSIPDVASLEAAGNRLYDTLAKSILTKSISCRQS
jgi:hypothetical protein